MQKLQKITPFLWFDNQAEEAALYYVSLFQNSKILNIARHTAAGPGPAGSVLVVSFELDGCQFTALNGGPAFKFTQAISFFVTCDTQAEIDRLWAALGDGGEEGQCGWVRDKYGLWWQVVPPMLIENLSSADKARSGRVMKAMMEMRKLDIATLQRAAERT
jgi:predicted 3-demethylubiquinone-9 3-methyltransferase (glyoxalase superfamily)